MSGQSLVQSPVQSPVQTLVRTDRRFRTGRALGWPARSGAALWLGALVLTSLPVFWLGIVSLGAAWATPEYSHGPLIPLISLFLFLRARREGPPRPAPGPLTPLPGLALIALALGMAVLGTLARIPDVVSYGLILWVGGVLLTWLGWAEGRRHGLAVLHLVFMLPLPQLLHWQLTTALQGVSATLGVGLIKAAGIPVYLDGAIIDLGHDKLLVAEACSGLRYLFPILSFSVLVALLYRGPLWHKALLFALAAPITVAMNALRIGLIGVLVDAHGLAAAEGVLHYFEGWVIFAACVALLVLAAWGLQQRLPEPQPLPAMLDLDTRGLGRELARLGRVAPTRALLAALFLGITFSAALLALPRPVPEAPPRAPFALFPADLGAWRGATTRLQPEIEAVLGASDYLATSFHAPGTAAPVALFAAWYHSQTDGQGIHSPEVCLPAGGWEIFEIAARRVALPGHGGIPLNRAVIGKGAERQLVYYWFEARGTRMTSDIAAKLAVLRDGITRGRSDGALVRLITPVLPAEPEGAADARLQALMADLLPVLPDFIPE